MIFPPEGCALPGGALEFKGILFYSAGRGSKVFYASGGDSCRGRFDALAGGVPMDIVLLLSALAVPGAGFCLLLSSNGK